MRTVQSLMSSARGAGRCGRVARHKLKTAELMTENFMTTQRCFHQRRADAAPTHSGVSVNLALQGGGAHGAFTWGVLDRLLEDERVIIRAASGASAGAVNAVALADGLAAGGRAGARAKLDAVWGAIIEAGQLRTPGVTSDHSPAFVAFDLMTRLFGPLLLNPLGVNPLREIVRAYIDFRRVRRTAPIELYIAATDVTTGQPRIFRRREMSAKAVLASTCLPQLMPPVRIAGRRYWDGGLSANPPLWPLVNGSESEETIVVLVNPRTEPTIPTTAPDIGARLSWLAFNQSVAQELAALDRARVAIDSLPFGGRLRRRGLQQRLSILEADAAVAGVGRASRLWPDRQLSDRLRKAGRDAAEAWLTERFAVRARRRETRSYPAQPGTVQRHRPDLPLFTRLRRTLRERCRSHGS